MSINIRTDFMQHAELFGNPVLFTNWLIQRDTIPKDWYCYDPVSYTHLDVYKRQGHYYAPGSGPNGYLSAKQDFCVRSGLMNQHRLFTNEQLAEVYRCVRETLECVYPITPERLRLLEGVACLLYTSERNVPLPVPR